MIINVSFAPVISLIAGILILLFPRTLNFVVAIHLIAWACWASWGGLCKR